MDNTSAVTLKGATFRLEKYTSDQYRQKNDTWEEQIKTDTNNTGVFDFSGLTSGYYKIVEVTPPNGYVKLSEDPTFRVVINDSDQLQIVFEDSENVKYSPETGFRYGNTPGAVLPSTGGPGTHPFRNAGLMFIAAAGVLYGMMQLHTKRRK